MVGASREQYPNQLGAAWIRTSVASMGSERSENKNVKTLFPTCVDLILILNGIYHRLAERQIIADVFEEKLIRSLIGRAWKFCSATFLCVEKR